MEVEPVKSGWAVFVDTIDGVRAMMTFDDMEEALFDMLDRLTELARIAEENGYTLPEVLKLIRHPKPEDYEDLPKGFEPIIVCKLDYDVREHDLIALGRLMK